MRKELKGEILKYLEKMKMETTHKNQWDAAKAFQKGKCIAISANGKKLESA